MWVKISDQGNKGNFMAGVYYRLADQGEPVDEAFLLQLQEALRSQALCPAGGLELSWYLLGKYHNEL